MENAHISSLQDKLPNLHCWVRITGKNIKSNLQVDMLTSSIGTQELDWRKRWYDIPQAIQGNFKMWITHSEWVIGYIWKM